LDLQSNLISPSAIIKETEMRRNPEKPFRQGHRKRKLILGIKKLGSHVHWAEALKIKIDADSK
jgi:hypothetical protein